ncbi:TIGR03086 family metal-binding protein [Winogradskya humida]|uniref:TIGR03086 family protein n=1 Tax=Winogradskya humida TaxID=113566 RepID=A0ABQ4A3H2_9ACTN|nr:TIGR03086 family metal-binding protein [Actinoplanes humidus]GIE25397.1 TIGR03086 family protein [Actinoplanes humidus]
MADRLPLDFDPPVRQVRNLLLGITDDHLTAPTPCPDWSVGDLLDHLLGLGWAFTQAANKKTDASGITAPPPAPAAAHLTPHWRIRLPVILDDLSRAWKQPAAWEGTSQAGGVTMPAAVTGAVAVNELTMHGWDLARATGQEYAADPRILDHLLEFLAQYPPEGTPGLFGPHHPLPDDPTQLDHALALTGRNPHWRPTTAAH